jgi:hypothetical protein
MKGVTEKEILEGLRLVRAGVALSAIRGNHGSEELFKKLETLLTNTLTYYQTTETYIAEREWLHREG